MGRFRLISGRTRPTSAPCRLNSGHPGEGTTITLERTRKAHQGANASPKAQGPKSTPLVIVHAKIACRRHHFPTTGRLRLPTALVTSDVALELGLDFSLPLGLSPPLLSPNMGHAPFQDGPTFFSIWDCIEATRDRDSPSANMFMPATNIWVRRSRPNKRAKDPPYRHHYVPCPRTWTLQRRLFDAAWNSWPIPLHRSVSCLWRVPPSDPAVLSHRDQSSL